MLAYVMIHSLSCQKGSELCDASTTRYYSLFNICAKKQLSFDTDAKTILFFSIFLWGLQNLISDVTKENLWTVKCLDMLQPCSLKLSVLYKWGSISS